MHHPTVRIAHTTAFVIPFVEQWLERENEELAGGFFPLYKCSIYSSTKCNNSSLNKNISVFPFLFPVLGRKEMFYLTTHSHISFTAI